MALAFLMSEMMKSYRGIKIADNPADPVLHAVIVDHGLRPGSLDEATKVCDELKRMGLVAHKISLNWKKIYRNGTPEPAGLSNLESLARTLRYQTLGQESQFMAASSLFFAHHQDDQYETLLMRLLSGHGYRGLQGMRAAAAIPECAGMHKIHRSGLLDDQFRREPFLSFKPPGSLIKLLRNSMKADRRNDPWKNVRSTFGLNPGPPALPVLFRRRVMEPRIPYVAPMSTEDGGVTIYRPLLEFSKDRLKATCEANNIKWFEDETNKDPTMTLRNAVRHLVANHELPTALQKPAVLALSSRARRRLRYEEAEAQRLLIREAAIQDFDPNVGTLLVEMPKFGNHEKTRTRRNKFQLAREEARKPRQKLIAAIALRKLIEFVSPDPNPPPLQNLENFVPRLFSSLRTEASDGPDKAFSLAGVFFQPFRGPSTTFWLLSRAPFASEHQPDVRLVGNSRYGVYVHDNGKIDKLPPRNGWRGWAKCKSWDDRFWIMLTSAIPVHYVIRPLQPEYLKGFRDALLPAQRNRLELVLQYYAPGKVRYTLPAVYSMDLQSDDPESTLKLVALPSLDVVVPSAKPTLRYVIRYKMVDTSLLELKRRRALKPEPLEGFRAAFGVSRQLRHNKLAEHRVKRQEERQRQRRAREQHKKHSKEVQRS